MKTPKNFQFKDITFELQRKNIKNLHLRLRPAKMRGALPTIKISAPLRLSMHKIEHFLLKNLSWIQQNQKKLQSLKFKAALKIADGEKHPLFDEKLTLKIIKKSPRNIIIKKDKHIELQCQKHLKFEDRQRLLDTLYRQELKTIIPTLIKKYEAKMGVKVKEFGVKKMKTRWGTCNIKDKRIWLALALATKPKKCLEMIVVHEMCHLLEKSHNKRFYGLMDQFMPNWREFDEVLKGVGN